MTTRNAAALALRLLLAIALLASLPSIGLVTPVQGHEPAYALSPTPLHDHGCCDVDAACSPLCAQACSVTALEAAPLFLPAETARGAWETVNVSLLEGLETPPASPPPRL